MLFCVSLKRKNEAKKAWKLNQNINTQQRGAWRLTRKAAKKTGENFLSVLYFEFYDLHYAARRRSFIEYFIMISLMTCDAPWLKIEIFFGRCYQFFSAEVEWICVSRGNWVNFSNYTTAYTWMKTHEKLINITLWCFLVAPLLSRSELIFSSLRKQPPSSWW